MQKTFSIIKKENKSYIIQLRLYSDSLTLTYVYNSISGTYMGTQITGFIGTFRRLLRDIPNFFEVMDEHEFEKSLIELGFIRTEPTEMDILFAEIN